MITEHGFSFKSEFTKILLTPNIPLVMIGQCRLREIFGYSLFLHLVESVALALHL